MTYLYDIKRHLICVPYSKENLHIMAKDLGIKKCWFHHGSKNYKHPHYDIPKKMQKEVESKARLVTQREILTIINNYYGLLRNTAKRQT